MALTKEQVNKLVEEYKLFYDGEEEVTEEKVLRDLKEYMKNSTNFTDFDELTFDELLEFIG